MLQYFVCTGWMLHRVHCTGSTRAVGTGTGTGRSYGFWGVYMFVFINSICHVCSLGPSKQASTAQTALPAGSVPTLVGEMVRASRSVHAHARCRITTLRKGQSRADGTTPLLWRAGSDRELREGVVRGSKQRITAATPRTWHWTPCVLHETSPPTPRPVVPLFEPLCMDSGKKLGSLCGTWLGAIRFYPNPVPLGNLWRQ